MHLDAIAHGQNPDQRIPVRGNFELCVTIAENDELTVIAKPLRADSAKPAERVHDLCMTEDTISALRAVEARWND
jgi:hypothetical protein